MRATLVASVAIALLAAALPLASQADARQGELATPTLGERGEDGARIMEWHGTSALRVAGVCLGAARACLGAHESVDGRFFLPAAASDGRVVVTWRAADDALRELRVTVGGVERVGESPLRFDFDGAAPGEVVVHAETNGTLAGAWEQPLSWFATFRVETPPRHVQLAGSAGYASTVGCALVLCEHASAQHGDSLVVPWRANGTVVVDWPADEGALHVGIAGTSFAAEGVPPLTLRLDGIEAGEWSLEVRPALAGPLSRVDARWSAQLVEREQTSS